MFSAPRLADERDVEGVRFGRAVLVLAAVQMLGGILNVLLLAPVWMQMVHLLLADALWIAFILLGARVLARPEPVLAAPRISTL